MTALHAALTARLDHVEKRVRSCDHGQGTSLLWHILEDDVPDLVGALRAVIAGCDHGHPDGCYCFACRLLGLAAGALGVSP